MNSIFLIVLLGVFILLPLLQIRKQNQRLKEIKQFQDALQVGMVVQTTSGLQGRITDLSEATCDLEIARGVVTTWDRAAVLRPVDAVESPAQAEQLRASQAPAASSSADSADAHVDASVDAPVEREGRGDRA